MVITYQQPDFKELFPEARLQGNFDGVICSIAPLDSACPRDLAFLANPKYKNAVPDTQAGVVLLPADYEGAPKENQLFIRVEDPSWALAKLCYRIEQKLFQSPVPGIHPSAYVHPQASVSPEATIGPFCAIGEGSAIGAHTYLHSHVAVGRFVSIGEGSILMPHVTVLDYCSIGAHVRLNPQVVIGSDGFGYSTLKDGIHYREPQVGKVIIEDEVEIGAGTTVDRARFKETRIGSGTKIDNLVQIGHNVKIGKNCLIVAQVGIAGSVEIEDSVVIGGQAGVAGHLKVGKGSMIAGATKVYNDLLPGSYVKGEHALPFAQAQRILALKKRLPELFKRVDALEAQYSEHMRKAMTL